MTGSSIFVGIDISKAQLDIAQRPSASRPVLPHTDTGIATLVEQLRRLRPVAIGLEAPGVEVPLVTALATAGLSVRVVNPRQVRAFVKATGQLAKTDPIDAQGLAHFAEAVRPTPRPLPDAATQALSARLTRRRQLLERRTAEQNRLSRAAPAIRRQIQTHGRWLDRQLAELEKDLTQRIRPPIWRERDELLPSAPAGVPC